MYSLHLGQLAIVCLSPVVFVGSEKTRLLTRRSIFYIFDIVSIAVLNDIGQGKKKKDIGALAYNFKV